MIMDLLKLKIQTVTSLLQNEEKKMGLWEKFKSSVGGETTDSAQNIDPGRLYEGANTELKPKTPVEKVSSVSAVELTDPEELFALANNYSNGTNGYSHAGALER
jgi:hypothetical protein